MSDPAPRVSRLAGRLRDDRGAATAEAAVVMPLIAALAVVLIAVGIVWSQQLRVESAARTAAREAARGESVEAATAAARRVAGPEAAVELRRSGAWVDVEVRRQVTPAAGPLLGPLAVTVRGSATAHLEPQLLGDPAGGAHAPA